MNLSRFHLVDEVVSLDDVANIRCRTLLPATATLFEEHFPSYPILPGTLQTEIMAQTCGLLSLARSNGQRIRFLVGVNKARFRQTVRPGHTLDVTARCFYENGPLALFASCIYVNTALVSSAEIRLSQVVLPTPELASFAHDVMKRTGLLKLLPVGDPSTSERRWNQS